MQKLTHAKPKPQSFDLRIQQSLSKLKNSATKWDTVERDQRTSDQYLGSADRSFQRSEFPLRRASFDTPSRDSSWEGRDIDRAFRKGDRELGFSTNNLKRAQNGLQQLDGDLDRERANLTRLASEMERSGDSRAEQIKGAIASLNQSDTGFGQVTRSWKSAESAGRFTDSEIWRAQGDIRRIASDRPGLNVSGYARRVSRSLDSIQRDLRQMDGHLRRSQTPGKTAETSLDQAIATLQGALNSGNELSN